ncbi:hypothetical protein FisN_3Hh203 [Fistulifera solaris]|uniref:Uncharacterized protein n=1 Tax=Fistulifera solaris TaxID=1519565 RepID=A0A1Z5JPP0_FISSO|nr:hypothetical protein FisN_3Hh203 [Fistulifera solaris]|eukprot:GAX15728.1 hypothetical protein FisN_3Hh203 [Fistulifera solaris]
MGCCYSSPHSKRKYRRVDPGDLDEIDVPLRYFGTNRAGSNLVPDDCSAFYSAYLDDFLPVNAEVVLYEAEIDHGQAFRCCSALTLPLQFLFKVPSAVFSGLVSTLLHCSFDQPWCWVRKEYSSRTFFRVYGNRIEINQPQLRIPFGFLGCGSWNSDQSVNHAFDRGAFGFSVVRGYSSEHACLVFPVFGGVVARHRCQCNGPVWNRMFTDCGGWWCDEWLCLYCCCTYKYRGLAHPDETAFASSIALQAFFEGRNLSKEDMDKCIAYWRDNISEQTDPSRRKRPVCCEPLCAPCCTLSCIQRLTHPKRNIPYKGDDVTDELEEVYRRYNAEAESQIQYYNSFYAPVRLSTFCRAWGCRRVCGRKGVCFCTEGCNHCDRKAGDPAPPLDVHDFDDECDASTILIKVLGPPPANVCIRRWRWDPELQKNVLDEYSTVQRARLEIAIGEFEKDE